MPGYNAHFWAGRFESQALLEEFFEESYSDEEDIPVSMFAESQGETWIDHDLIECGYEENDLPVEEKFAGYSYAAKWMPEFKRRITELGLPGVNTIVMCSIDESAPPIAEPQPFNGDGYLAAYLGVLELE
jgi:hypothetical protein